MSRQTLDTPWVFLAIIIVARVGVGVKLTVGGTTSAGTVPIPEVLPN